MAYKALYRVFRPTTFSEVVMQDHIITVLKNQVKSGHVSHAYLFCGGRGTGKTSVAKIFARAICCETPVDGEPCLKCNSCVQSLNDTSVDIIEIDAASNNGVDEIRELRDKVKFSPANGKYKVYIIDEVHMLTSGAFNALLKTLEEPPAHAVFILATTEPQKLPATVISRCQRYDFLPIATDDIVKRLREIAEKMDIKADEDALFMIAKSANGGLRDAISLMDQVMAYGGKRISEQDVITLLGTTEKQKLFEIGDMIQKKDIAGLLLQCNTEITAGNDVTSLTKEIINHFRLLLIIKVCGGFSGIAQVDKLDEKNYLNQSKDISSDRLIAVVEKLSSAVVDMKYATTPIICLELALMEICNPSSCYDNLAIHERLSEIEKRLDKIEAGGISFAVSQPKESKKIIGEIEKTIDSIEKQVENVDNIEKIEAAVVEEKETKDDSIKASNTKPIDKNVFEQLLSKIKKEDKALFIILQSSTFESFEKDLLTIAYDEKSSIFSKATSKAQNKDKVIQHLSQLGYPDVKICVTIGKEKEQNSIESVLELFGKDKVQIID